MSSNSSNPFVQYFNDAVDQYVGQMVENKLGEHGGGDGGFSRDAVIDLIEEHAPSGGGDGGLSEAEVINLIDEHAGGGHDHGDVLTTEDVVSLINEHAPSDGGGGNFSEDEIVALIEEHAPAGGGSGGGGGGGDSDRLNELLDRAEAALDDLESELARIVGPDSPSGEYHTHAGWGIQFETEEPIHFGQATIDAMTNGSVNVELHAYESGSVQGLVDSTELSIAREGEQDVDIDIDVEEPGQYLLTRDWETEPDNVISMRRVMDYAGWDGDSDDMLTFYGGAHDEYSDNQHWYYWTNLHVKPLRNKDEASDSGAEKTGESTA